MKPHEETWTWAPQYQHIETPEGGDVGIYVDDRALDESEKARLVLAAQAPAMARLLLAIEWKPLGTCPACGGLGVAIPDNAITGPVAATGHRPTCELAAVLRAAGVLP